MEIWTQIAWLQVAAAMWSCPRIRGFQQQFARTSVSLQTQTMGAKEAQVVDWSKWDFTQEGFLAEMDLQLG